MTPALQSWLLSVPYLAVGIGLFVIAWVAGGLFYYLLLRQSGPKNVPWYVEMPGMATFVLMVRIASGLALISWIGAAAGVAGKFYPVYVLVAIGCLLIAGLILPTRVALMYKPSLLRDRFLLRKYRASATKGERWFTAAIALVLSAIVINAIIGAMVPDMNQDPMWYHLTLPQQWMFSGRYGVYPSALQSAYPLAVESIFAIIFLIGGNPVMCSLLIAISGILLFAALLSATWAILESQCVSHRMWGVGAVAGVLIPLLTMYGLIAPVQPKNDMLTLFWSTTGIMILMIPLLADRPITSSAWWVVSGFLCGTAICAKPTVLSMVFFAGLFIVLLIVYNGCRTGKGFRQSGFRLCLWVVAMAFAAAPWLLRGWLSSGVPLYPVGTSLFKMAPEFEAMHNGLSRIQGVPGLGLQEWLHKLTAAWDRIYLGAGHGEKFFFLYLVAVLSGCLTLTGRWRWFSVTLILQLIFIVGMTAAVEIFRFFATVYCLAIPLMALLVARVINRISVPLRFILAGLMCLGVWGSILDLQLRTGRQKTFSWEYRPVLSEEDVNEYATHAEMGALYLRFQQLQPLIDPNARVLLFDVTYPFYLHRNTLWNDEIVRAGGWLDSWSRFNASQAYDFLRAQKIDAILYAPRSSVDPTLLTSINALQSSGVLTKRKIPANLEQESWGLWEMQKPLL